MATTTQTAAADTENMEYRRGVQIIALHRVNIINWMYDTFFQLDIPLRVFGGNGRMTG